MKEQAIDAILAEVAGSGVVYVATVKESERLYDVLKAKCKVAKYHGKMCASTVAAHKSGWSMTSRKWTCKRS